MSVYNDERYLRKSIDSILEQDNADFEFVIIDDGSEDNSPAILDEYKGCDDRIRIIRQGNNGLTKALIRGCEEARGRFIARQDADDLSLSGRLARLSAMLRNDDHLAFVSSWAEVIGPEDEILLLHKRPAGAEDATKLLLEGRVGPPGHGSVMFRKSSYEKVGGYRPQFYYAQDSDLWLRMGEAGKLAYAQECLYQYRISGSSMSGAMHSAKLPFAKMVEDCFKARRQGQSEKPFLNNAPDSHTNKNAVQHSSSRSDTLYFIGNCLLRRRDPRAISYFRRCIKSSPFHARAWLGVLRSLVA